CSDRSSSISHADIMNNLSRISDMRGRGNHCYLTEVIQSLSTRNVQHGNILNENRLGLFPKEVAGSHRVGHFDCSTWLPHVCSTSCARTRRNDDEYSHTENRPNPASWCHHSGR